MQVYNVRKLHFQGNPAKYMPKTKSRTSVVDT